MLFWLFVIVAVLGAALYFASKYWDRHSDWCRSKNPVFKWLYYNSDGFTLAGALMFWLSVAAIVISLVGILIVYTEAPGTFALNEARYEALTYKMESPTCRDEFGFLSKEVIDEVQNWNESLAGHKAMQRNFWIGIYIPNIYDSFEFIDYHSYVPLGGG